MGSLDTAADGHYIQQGHQNVLHNVRPVTGEGFPVRTADNTVMVSTHTGDLALDPRAFPPAALTAHVFADTAMADSLLSVPKFANSSLTTVFTNADAFIVNERDPPTAKVLDVLRQYKITAAASRDSRGMWLLPLISTTHADQPLSPPPGLPARPVGQASAVIHHEGDAAKALFLHRLFGSPSVSTLLTAMDKALFVYPGITAAMVRKNKPTDYRTAMGHMRLINKNLRSTKPQTPTDTPPDDTFHPSAELPTHAYYTRVKQISAQQYMDATGALPVRSHDGFLYILCIYDYDSNPCRTPQVQLGAGRPRRIQASSCILSGEWIHT